MPTYEYRCESCGRSFDVVQGFHDAALTTCDVCAGSLRKVFAPVGIVFKGSGFYKNDSRTASPRASSGATKEDSTSAKESSNGADASSTGSKESTSSGGAESGAASTTTTPVKAASDGAKAKEPKAAPKPA
jgi:putative FmdB family regulatory protein